MKREEDSKKPRVLLSAYACEPGKGSEPGVGWAWALGLSRIVDLTVLTRSNNQNTIEAALKLLPADHSAHSLKFIYRDLGWPCKWLKRMGILPTGLYYLVWQFFITKKMARHLKGFDITHHLTFCTPLCSGFWGKSSAAKVIGPVGAPVVDPHYLRLFGRGSHVQRIRNWVFMNLRLVPWVRRTFKEAGAVFPANSDARKLLQPLTEECREVMLDTGSLQEVEDGKASRSDVAQIQFLSAGVLEKRKGIELAIRGFARFLETESANGSSGCRFKIVGDGPDSARLQELAYDLGVGDQVDFEGRVSQKEVGRFFASSDVFVFASVRDTSGGVNLEAMAYGLPLLCLAHQGVGDITDEECAVRVAPGSIEATIAGFAHGMARLSADPSLRKMLGESGLRRAREVFSWERKFARMEQVYRELIERGGAITRPCKPDSVDPQSKIGSK